MRAGKNEGSELVVIDGRFYHLDLQNGQVPTNVFLVGAPERVNNVSEHFDRITLRHKNEGRPEFSVAAGIYRRTPVAVINVGLPLAVMSNGIGVDNTEIALIELHALWEFQCREKRWSAPVRANIIRIGTCGTSLPEIPVGACAISKYAIGLDNLGVYYPPIFRSHEAERIARRFSRTSFGRLNPALYCSTASPKVVAALQKSAHYLGEDWPWTISGITTASPGFYAPQGRAIGRIKVAPGVRKFVSDCRNFRVRGERIVNHEMETSILFRLGWENLGYHTGAICLVVANRSTNKFLEKEEFDKRMNVCIEIALQTMRTLASSA